MRKDSSSERWSGRTRRRRRRRKRRRRNSQGSNHALVQGFAAAISLVGPIYYVEK
jgi:hypothetical protein